MKMSPYVLFCNDFIVRRNSIRGRGINSSQHRRQFAVTLRLKFSSEKHESTKFNDDRNDREDETHLKQQEKNLLFCCLFFR